ncbi:NEAT domain-containing protein [Sporosarcina sp. CAU 1771]
MRKKAITSLGILFFVMTLFSIVSPQQASANSKFADGEYTIPFTVLKGNSNEQSATAEYVVSPAKVIIQNGNTHVVMTLNNSSWWQYFKVNSSDVQVLSENGDKRVVKFPIQDVEQLVNAKIHIIVTGIPGFNYDNKYDIRFKFNSSNIPLASIPEKPVNPAPPAPAPSTPNKVETKPSQKPTEKPVEKKEEIVMKEIAEKVETNEKATDKSNNQKNVNEESIESVDVTVQPEDEEAFDTDSDEAEASESDELEVNNAEEPEELVETADEEVMDELKSESKSNISKTLFLVIIVAILLGVAFVYIRKKKSQI